MSQAREPAESRGGDPAWGDEPLLEVRDLKKHFPVNTGFISSLRLNRDGGFPIELDDRVVRAVDGVSFELHPGQTLGVVGESGCGKSTLARTLLGLETPTAGTIRFQGRDVTDFSGDAERHLRRNAQIVFQDPGSSLNPRRKVGEIIADPLTAAGWDEDRKRDRVLELLEEVGLEGAMYNRYPHEFSGGQKQRINLARALSVSPDLVVADEPVSGLDTSVQAQILNLMDRLQDEFGLTYLLITHDLSVIRHIADRVAVMYVGKFVETATTETLFTKPHHPYTRALLDSIPNPNPDARAVTARLEGDVPSPSDPPPGCTFHTRCPEVIPPDSFSGAAYRRFVGFKQSLAEERLETDRDDVVEEYFADVADGFPQAAREAAAEAARLAAAEEWEAAREAVDTFTSVCETDPPPLEAVADGHQSACHLPAAERRPYEW